MATRKKTTAPAPVILTPEQIEAQARREAEHEAHCAAREALITKARGLAEAIRPGRVVVYDHDFNHFAVMFGDPSAPRCSFAGPGIVELSVDLAHWSFRSDSANATDLTPPALRFTPRCYSLGSSDGIDGCEAQGRALIEAAAFARMLQALTA